MSYNWSMDELALAGGLAQFGGRMGGLGKITVLQAPQGEIATAQRGYEGSYAQIQALTNQLAGAVNEVAQAAMGVTDPEILSLLDDAKLLAQEATSAAQESKAIYNLDEAWVRSNLAEGVHGGWGFGREVVISGKTDSPGNRSRRALDPWNRNQILQAAANGMNKVVSEVSQALGQIRALRAQIVGKAQSFALNEKTRLANEQRTAQAQAYQDAQSAAAQAREDQRQQRQYELEERQQAAQEAAQQRAQDFEERRQQALEAAEARKVAMQEQLEQSRLNAEQSRIQSQIDAEARQVALQQQQQEQALAVEAYRQQAQLQAELAKSYPAYSQQGAMGVPQYGTPPGMLGPGFVDPHAGYANAPQVVGLPAPDTGWGPGNELFGMHGMGLTLGPQPPLGYVVPGAPRQTSALDTFSNFLTKVGPTTADVIGAARGVPRPGTYTPEPQSDGPGLGTVVGVLAVGAGLWYLLKGSKGGGKKRKPAKRRSRRGR